MTTDAGMQELLGRYAGQADPGLTVEIDADLAVSVGGLVAEMRRDRARRELFDQKMQEAIRHVPLKPDQQLAGTPATFASRSWVCKTGYVWYLQSVTAKNLGSTDTVWVYRVPGGLNTATALPDEAAKWPLTATSPAWLPGRTGFRIGPEDGIAVQGTTTNTVTVNLEMIILEQWIEPDFLL